jgi:hypothetical protein
MLVLTDYQALVKDDDRDVGLNRVVWSDICYHQLD